MLTRLRRNTCTFFPYTALLQKNAAELWGCELPLRKIPSDLQGCELLEIFFFLIFKQQLVVPFLMKIIIVMSWIWTARDDFKFGRVQLAIHLRFKCRFAEQIALVFHMAKKVTTICSSNGYMLICNSRSPFLSSFFLFPEFSCVVV